MPSVTPQYIKARRDEVKNKPRPAQLRLIAGLHPKKTVPIILTILNDALPVLERDPENKVTLDFAAFVKGILIQVRDNQEASLWNIPGLLKKFNETIHNDLAKLDRMTKEIKVTPQTAAFWQEAEVWLQGWYKRSFDLAPKDRAGVPKRDASGKYERYDLEDKALFSYTKLTKLEVAEYYQRLAVEITRQLEALQVAQQQAPVAQVPAAAAADQAAAQEAMPDIIEIEPNGSGTRFIINLPDKDKATLKRIRDAVMLALNPEQEILSIINGRPLTNYGTRPDDKGMAEMLDSVENESNDARFAALEIGVRDIGLTGKQAEMLAGIKKLAITKLEAYCNKPYRVPLTNIAFFPGYLEHANVGLVKQTVAELEESETVEDQLGVILDLRYKLTLENSTRALPEVDNVLNTAITILRKVPNHEVVLASAPRP